MDDCLIVTPSKASKLICVGHDEMYRLLESGEIPAFKNGSAWKIPREGLQNYVMARANEESRQRREINER